MEKSAVLSKLFQISARLQNDRIRHKSVRGEAEDGQVRMRKMEALPGSGKRLLCLLKNSGMTNQRTLAKQMDISAQAVSETIKKLEQQGYIIKTCGIQNNENLIDLTSQGAEIATRLDQRIKAHAQEVLKEFSDAELETLYALLLKISVES